MQTTWILSVGLLLLTATPLHGVEDCTSCVGRCGPGHDYDYPCQCNTVCEEYRDCCEDYGTVCETFGSFYSKARACGVTDTELKELSEELWQLDENRLPETDYTLNLNTKFFDYVDESHFEKTSFRRLLDMYDNYNPFTGTEEEECDHCRQEENAFLNTMLESAVLQAAWKFLSDRGLASTVESEFKEELRQYWFLPYSRSEGGPLDSSGFEHVFVGEIKDNAVSGYHGWVKLYLDEKDGSFLFSNALNSCSVRNEEFSHDWLGYPKTITSVFVGSSPEFQVSMITVCLLSRPNDVCPLSLDGVDTDLQTWTITGEPITVGSAYYVC